MLPNNQLHCRQSTQFLGFSFIAHVHIHNKSWAIFKWRFTRSCLCQPYFNFRAKKNAFCIYNIQRLVSMVCVVNLIPVCIHVCMSVGFFSNNGCPIRVNYELVRKQISAWPNNWIEKKTNKRTVAKTVLTQKTEESQKKLVFDIKQLAKLP